VALRLPEAKIVGNPHRALVATLRHQNFRVPFVAGRAIPSPSKSETGPLPTLRGKICIPSHF
jgi:hypothetical protein